MWGAMDGAEGTVGRVDDRFGVAIYVCYDGDSLFLANTILTDGRLFLQFNVDVNLGHGITHRVKRTRFSLRPVFWGDIQNSSSERSLKKLLVRPSSLP